MSFGGILAQALAGGAGAIRDQATGDIDAQRRADLMRQQADIEEQMRMRLSEFSEKQRRSGVLWETSGEGGAAKLDLARRTGEQANDLAIKGKVAEATNPELRTALDEKAEADLQREIRKIKETAKPEAEKAAAIAEARARAEAKYRKADPTVQDKVAQMEKALGRPLTEQEKLGAMGLAKELNKETGYETVEEKEYDANGQEIRKRTRKEPLKPGQGGGTKPTEQQAHAEAEAAIKSGAPRDAVNARLKQAGFNPLGGDAGAKPAAAEKPARSKPMLQTGPVAIAEIELRQAIGKLNSYGSSQRQRDPDGFRQAQARVAEAQAALAAAQESESGPIPDDTRRPAMRYSAP